MVLVGEVKPTQALPVRVVRASDRRSLSRSATRALDVLEFFGEARRPLRAVEIARQLNLHPSTANQLLKTMVESAHLAFDVATKTYLPTPRLTRFCSWQVDNYGSDERLRRLIAEVHALSNEVVTLTTPNDRFMQVIDLVGGDALAPGAERGLRVSIFGTAIGSAYLASLPLNALKWQAERMRVPASEHGQMLERMMLIRQDGYATGPSAQGKIWSVAAALPEGSYKVPLVLGLSGPADRVKPNLASLGRLLKTSIGRVAARPREPG